MLTREQFRHIAHVVYDENQRLVLKLYEDDGQDDHSTYNILRAMGAKHSNEMVGKSEVMYASYGSTIRPPFVEEVEYVYKFCQEYKNAIM